MGLGGVNTEAVHKCLRWPPIPAMSPKRRASAAFPQIMRFLEKHNIPYTMPYAKTGIVAKIGKGCARAVCACSLMHTCKTS
jgi:hypothetical protein